MADYGIMDWNTGTWLNSQSGSPELEVAITSDWAPIRAFDELISDKPESVYGDLLPVLRQSDFSITNLECPLTDINSHISKSGSVLKGCPRHVRGLKAVPFDAVTMANNHVFDYGLDGFNETMSLLKDHGIQTVGAGATEQEAKQTLVVKINGTKVALINFSEGEDLTWAQNCPGVFGWEVEEVLTAVEQAKGLADLVIVICHAGVEYIPFPPPYVAESFRRIADAGADLVIGHHPHVPQGIEIHHGTPICYSLGNFVFYQETDLQFRKVGYFVKVGLTQNSVAHLKVIPYGIYPHGLKLLDESGSKWFFDSLQEVSEPLSDLTGVEDAWHGFLRNYGTKGFVDEINMLMDKLKNDPDKGAAMFRNRITTMQHNQHWVDALTRMINGQLDSSPDWALDLTRKWLTEQVPENWK